MLMETDVASKKREALQFAQTLYPQTNDWVAFFRKTLGVSGIVHKLFDTAEGVAEFEQSEEFREIQQMVSELRKKRRGKKDKNSHREPTKVITVRMPKSLHELLTTQATNRGISINNLCISKLLQMIEHDQATG